LRRRRARAGKDDEAMSENPCGVPGTPPAVISSGRGRRRRTYGIVGRHPRPARSARINQQRVCLPS
jgi:hypothetical protein